MSMTLEFEPHSWYMGFAIYDNRDYHIQATVGGALSPHKWHAFIDNGNTYRIDELEADTLTELKQKIRYYHVKQASAKASGY